MSSVAIVSKGRRKVATALAHYCNRASWMNMVERFFRSLSEDRLKRGVFQSLGELITAIEQYVGAHNENPKPFVWTKDARDILQKVIRAREKLEIVQTA